MTPAVQAAQTARHKNFLRGFYRAKVMGLTREARRRLSDKAVQRLAALPVFREAQTLGLFASMDGEIETTGLFDLCQRAGKAVSVPVVFPEEVRMEFALLAAPLQWTVNVYGIPEPVAPRFLDPRNIELLVVPGRAFTPDGRRLGVGAGYYDRFLELHPHLATAGLAFDEQITPRLPFNALDRSMDIVVTPTRVFSRRSHDR